MTTIQVKFHGPVVCHHARMGAPESAVIHAASGRLRALAISDGATGNRRQAEALVAALGLSGPHVAVDLSAPWSWLAPRLGWQFERSLPPDTLAIIEAAAPELVVGCGRRAAAVTAWLRATRGCRAVQILDPRMDTRHWDLVIAPAHDKLSGANVLTTLGSLHAISPRLLAEAALRHADLTRLPTPRTALLLGGPLRGFRMDARYLDTLFNLLEARRPHHAGALMVTTSRRTPLALRAQIETRAAQWPGRVWHPGGEDDNPYHGFLAHADEIVVTPDSVNMQTEACALGLPVYTHAPVALPGKLGLFHAELIERGHVRPLKPSVPGDWTPLALREMPALVAAVRQRLGLGALGGEVERPSLP